MQLLEENKYKILRICSVYAQLPEDRKDLFQEVVLQLWKSFDTLQNHLYAHTWFYRVTLNVCMQVQRKPKHPARLSLDSITFLSNAESAHERLEKQEQRDNLYHCIAQLDPGNRAIMLLYLEGVPNQQIAEISGLTANHVAVKLKRIREKISICLKRSILC